MRAQETSTEMEKVGEEQRATQEMKRRRWQEPQETATVARKRPPRNFFKVLMDSRSNGKKDTC